MPSCNCFVNSPPFWNLFRELGDLKEQRGAGTPDTGGGATPLVDATVRFFKEFSAGEGSPSTQRRSQAAICGTSRADEEKNDDNVDPFEPAYLYDAMKEKRQLKPLLVRSPTHVWHPVTNLYWPNVYRTANSRTRKNFFVCTLTRLKKSCPRYSLLVVVAGLPDLHLNLE